MPGLLDTATAMDTQTGAREGVPPTFVRTATGVVVITRDADRRPLAYHLHLGAPSRSGALYWAAAAALLALGRLRLRHRHRNAVHHAPPDGRP